MDLQLAMIDKQYKDQLAYLEKIMGCHNLSKKLTKSNRGKFDKIFDWFLTRLLKISRNPPFLDRNG